MSVLYYIGQEHCGDCNRIRDEVVGPVFRKYPGRVRILYSWCDDIARINRRKEIDRVPLFVVEDEHGNEEFRYSGELSSKQLESLIAKPNVAKQASNMAAHGGLALATP